MRERIEAEPPLEVYVTGWSGITADYNSAIKEADIKLFGATVALVLILLIAVYRSPILALVPLLVVGMAFSVANGIIYLLNQGIGLPVDTASNSLLLVLMFGAGTDYCLLLISRYGDRLQAAGVRPGCAEGGDPGGDPADGGERRHGDRGTGLRPSRGSSAPSARSAR